MEEGGYLGIAALMFTENLFPPIPSELIMPLERVRGATVLGAGAAEAAPARSGSRTRGVVRPGTRSILPASVQMTPAPASMAQKRSVTAAAGIYGT